jgi:predicted permease
LGQLFHHIGLHDLISLGILFSGLTLALLLAFAKRPDKKANPFLGLALAVVSLKASGLTALLLPALGPLLYFYTRQLTSPDRLTGPHQLTSPGLRLARTDLLHFCLLPIGCWLPAWVALLIALPYIYLSHRLIGEFYHKLRLVSMDRPRSAFRQLDKTLLLTGLFCVLSPMGDIAYCGLAITLMGIAVAALLKTEGAEPTDMPVTEKYDAKDKGRRLKQRVTDQRLYEDPELTLVSLAEKLDIPPHELSRIINLGLEKNFSDFVNELRIREVVRKMQGPDLDQLTLLGIAYDAGFNSKTTFNRVFKQMTGKTPTEYKNSLKKEVPNDKLAPRLRIKPVILRLGGPPVWASGKSKRNYMFRSYVKIAWRNLGASKVFSAINVLGLAAGMAIAILIGLWIWDELTYDRSFANHQRLAEVMTTSLDNDGNKTTDMRVCQPIAPELRSKYGSDFRNISMSRWNRSAFAMGDNIISATGMWVEEKFPAMFSLQMIKGNIDALSSPSSILINSSFAKALFGDADPIGKTVRMDNSDNFTVAGVYGDFPANSTFSVHDIKYFLPWKKYITREQWVKESVADWSNRSWECFVELADHVDMDKETEKIKNVVMAHKTKAEGVESAYLYPMDKWHLYSEFKDGRAAAGAIQFVRLFSIIGIFVLLLACINFMNLSTARSEKRAKEVGVRKAVGSLRNQLVRQFLTESVLVALVSFIFSILLVLLLLPFFNSLASKDIQLPWRSPVFWLCTLAFTVITGLLSGSYPALYLSGFDPIEALKGSFRAGRYAALPRKVLVVAQFTFSIALIIGTIVVFKQVQFAKNRPINYRKEGLITVDGVTEGLPGFYDGVRNDLLATGVVDNMAGASDATTNLGAWRTGFNWEGKNPNTLPSFGFMLMTEDYGRTIGWQLKEGRDFSKDFSTDSFSMVLNEAAVKQIGMKKDIVGENIQFDGKNYHVIGVVKDMIQESPYRPVAPMVYVANRTWIGVVTVAIKTGVPVKDALAKIEKAFKKYNPNLPFNYAFNDEEYAKKFADEERVGKLATFFTILAIFISCLGLFGLTAFVAEQRKKEIGIRKVLGASTFRLWQMLSREFAWLVVIASVIAIPLAWYYSHNWLQQYEYRTTLSAWVFVASGVGAFVITLLTVSFQAIKAALANPVKSLRTDG